MDGHRAGLSRALRSPRSSRRSNALIAAGLLGLVLVAVAVLPAARTMVGAALDADTDAVRRLRDLGPLGPILLSLAILAHAAVYLGSRLQDPAASDRRLWLAGSIALALLLGVRAAVYLRGRRGNDDDINRGA